MKMNGPSLFVLSLCLLAVSLVLFLAGFPTPHWMNIDSLHLTYGIWTICSPSNCLTIEAYLGGSPGGHIYLARVAGMGQLFACVASLAMLLLFAFKAARESWAKAAYSTALFAGIVGFLGAVIFIGREKANDTASSVDVSWSGILVIIAAILETAAGICILLPVHRGQVGYEQA